MPPSCTQLLCLSQVPKLYQQLYPPLHLGSGLFSLSLPRLHIKRWKHKRRQHKLIPGIFMLCKSSMFFSFCQSYKESNFYCNLVKSSKPSKLWQVDHQEEYPWNLHVLPCKGESGMPYYLKWFINPKKKKKINREKYNKKSSCGHFYNVDIHVSIVDICVWNSWCEAVWEYIFP